MTTCAVCNEEISSGAQWLSLNRYGVGSGSSRLMAEVTTRGQYEWHQADEGEDADDEYATQAQLHWPICAQMFIEGRIAELHVMFPP